MKNFILISALFLFTFGACTEDDNDCPPESRTGAICNDGTTSSATGSGACSGHGGVSNWLCN